MLGINRRNHDYLFRWNRRDRWALVDDKVATKERLAAVGVPVPDTLAVCRAPWELAGLPARLAAHAAFACKPARGAGGGGIVVVTGRAGDALVGPGGRRLRWADLLAHAADVLSGVHSLGGREDVVLLEACVVPDAVLGGLAGQGVPDLRVVVLRGVPILAMLRLPTRRSGGRANLHLGGVGVGIALGTGRTTGGMAGGAALTTHPDTGAGLVDVAVPAWPSVLELAVRAADASGLGFVGVDLVCDAGHGPLVLELNARPGLAIQAANRTGLRRPLERVAALPHVPETVAERIALGRALTAASG
jgi:alpha-L-glutamate ligase-like protein